MFVVKIFQSFNIIYLAVFSFVGNHFTVFTESHSSSSILVIWVYSERGKLHKPVMQSNDFPFTPLNLSLNEDLYCTLTSTVLVSRFFLTYAL